MTTTTIQDTKLISVFQGQNATKPIGDWTLKQIIEEMKHATKRQGVAKENLPAATFGAQFTDARKKDANKVPTGYVHFDFDKLPNAQHTFEQFKAWPHTKAAFISPSGNGVKVVVDVEPVPLTAEEYEKAYEEIKQHLPVSMGLDEACKDITRYVFLPYAPTAFYNEEAEVMSLNTNNWYKDRSWQMAGAGFTPQEIEAHIRQDNAGNVHKLPTHELDTTVLRPDRIAQLGKRAGNANSRNVATIEDNLPDQYEWCNFTNKVKDFDFDIDLRMLQSKVHRTGFTPGLDNLSTAVISKAKKNQVHPVTDWLKTLVWDETPRLASVGKYWSVNPSQLDNELCALLFRGIVARVVDPGCEMRTMVTLYGEQGVGKTGSLKVIAGDWWGEAPSLDGYDLSKQTMEVSVGRVLLEVSELKGMQRAEVGRLKAWISRTADVARKAYGRGTTDQPRQFILAGTANKIQLTDETGNTRYGIVHVDQVDFEGLIRDRDQLFAEAYATHTNGPVAVPEKFWAEASERTEDFRVATPLEKAIDRWLTGNEYQINSSAVREWLEGVTFSPNDLKEVMNARGFVNKQIGKAPNRKSVWENAANNG